MAQRRDEERNDPEREQEHNFNGQTCPKCGFGMYDDGPVLESPFPPKVWSQCSNCDHRERRKQ